MALTRRMGARMNGMDGGEESDEEPDFWTRGRFKEKNAKKADADDDEPDDEWVTKKKKKSKRRAHGRPPLQLVAVLGPRGRSRRRCRRRCARRVGGVPRAMGVRRRNSARERLFRYAELAVQVLFPVQCPLSTASSSINKINAEGALQC